jgi:hypothetical protein
MDAMHAVTAPVDALTTWLDGQCPTGVVGYARVAPATVSAVDGWFLVGEADGHGDRYGLPMAGDSTAVLVVDVTACGRTAALALALSDLLDERLLARAGTGAWVHTPDTGAGLTVIDRSGERGPVDVAGGIAQRAGRYRLTVHRT